MTDDEHVKEMVTYEMDVKIHNTPATAPVYDEDWTMLKIDTAMVVKKGTVAGRPTVDLQMTDGDGNQFVVMVTGAIVDGIAAAVKGAS